MLRGLKYLEHCAILADDGVIGHVKDFYSDEVAWSICYLVVDAAAWLSSRTC